VLRVSQRSEIAIFVLLRHVLHLKRLEKLGGHLVPIDVEGTSVTNDSKLNVLYLFLSANEGVNANLVNSRGVLDETAPHYET